MYMESEKIRKRIHTEEDRSLKRDWKKVVAFVEKGKLNEKDRDIAMSHLAYILGRSFQEVVEVYPKFASTKNPDRLLHVVYWLGKIAFQDENEGKKREITFSPVLRERIGHHIHSAVWAYQAKKRIYDLNLSLNKEYPEASAMELFEILSNDANKASRKKVHAYAVKNGMYDLKDGSSSHINVQLFDTAKIKHLSTFEKEEAPILLVMDYAFGEQAYGAMDELLKPFEIENKNMFYMNVISVSIMGKAGILCGEKGDIMIPTSHILEGTAGNYPFENQLKIEDFKDCDSLKSFDGSMVTVLGTSLQNRDLLSFFHNSTWDVIGLEMEGAHYQKAIQAVRNR